MPSIRRFCILCALILASTFASSVHAQTPPAAPMAFPYSFTNFVWWTDAGLRAEIHRRLPSLPDAIVVGSTQEHALRSVLETLLRQKGIVADIQAIAPGPGAAHLERDPDAPPPSIEFSIMEPPHIVIGHLAFDAPPASALDSLNQVATRLDGRAYNSNSFWMHADQVRRPLQELGYLAVTVLFEPGSPNQSAPNTYTVPIHIRFNLGPQFHIASISADGGPLAAGHDLSPYFAAHPGDVAQLHPFGRLEGALRNTYASRGYMDVTIHDDPVLDTTHALATYHLTLDPGPQYRFNALTLKNLNSAQEAYLHAHFPLKPGDLYDQSAIINLYRELGPLQEFSGLSFSFGVQKNRQQGTVDVTLEFFKK